VPANLTPEYHQAEEDYRRAGTTEEKLAALQRMLAVIPKHKGTEKIQADLKKRISKLKDAGERKPTAKAYNPYLIKCQGGGQVVLIGFPNSGKSSLVARLTGSTVDVDDYPFTTKMPQPRMMPYKDIMIQLVDTPPVTAEAIDPLFVNLLQACDLILIVVDVAVDSCLDQLDGCLKHLTGKHIVADDSWERCLLVLNKTDVEAARERLTILEEFIPPGLDKMRVSSLNGRGLDDLKQEVFSRLHIIRVYSKIPGKAPDMKAPFVIPRGSTILDFASAVHKDLARDLEKARVWGSARFDGQAVPQDYQLADGDIVELHVQKRG